MSPLRQVGEIIHFRTKSGRDTGDKPRRILPRDACFAARADNLHRNNRDQDQSEKGHPKNEYQSQPEYQPEDIDRIANPGIDAGGYEFRGFGPYRKRVAQRITRQDYPRQARRDI